MKIKVQKKELKECIENAVLKVLNEMAVKEGYYEDDDNDSDVLKAFLRDPKNKIKRQKGGAAARKAAMADIKKELDSQERDDKAIEDDEKSERAED